MIGAAGATGAGIPVGWRRRAEPLVPDAVLGTAGVASALALAAAARIEAGARLEVHAGGRLVLVIGPSDQLPWVDGATWLGTEDGVLVPTTIEPTPDPALVARAARLAAPGAGWIVLAPDMRLEGERALDPPDVPAIRRLAATLAIP